MGWKCPPNTRARARTHTHTHTHTHTQPATPHLLDRLVHGLLEDSGHQQRDAGHQQKQGQRPHHVEAAPAHSAYRSRAGRPATGREGGREGGAAAVAAGRPGAFGRLRPGRCARLPTPRPPAGRWGVEGPLWFRFPWPGQPRRPCGAAREEKGARRAETLAGRALRSPGRRQPAAARGSGRGGG